MRKGAGWRQRRDSKRLWKMGQTHTQATRLSDIGMKSNPNRFPGPGIDTRNGMEVTERMATAMRRLLRVFSRGANIV